MDSEKTFVNYRLIKSVFLVAQWTLMLTAIAIMVFGKMPWFGKILLTSLSFLGAWKFFKLQVEQNEKVIRDYQEAVRKEREEMPRLRYWQGVRRREEFKLYWLRLKTFKKKPR